jgi:hypothetical protein
MVCFPESFTSRTIIETMTTTITMSATQIIENNDVKSPKFNEKLICSLCCWFNGGVRVYNRSG